MEFKTWLGWGAAAHERDTGALTGPPLMRALRRDEVARNPDSLLILDALTSFRIHHHDLKETTLEGYAISIRQYAQWLVAQGRQPVVANLELGLVDAWIAGYRREISPQTRKIYSASKQLQLWAGLRKFAQFAADEYLHRDASGGSVLARLRMPALVDDRRRELSDEELGRVLAAAKAGPCGARNYAIVFSDAALGLRRGELIGLRLGEINWPQRYLVVRRTTSKGRPEARKVTLGPEVVKVLHHWVFDERVGDPDDDGEVFMTEDGRAMTPSAFNRMARGIKARSGVKRYCLHLGRHTWATNFRRAGTGDLLDLQRQGGWRDRRSVERYTHDRPDAERRSAPSPMSVLKRRPPSGGALRPRSAGPGERARGAAPLIEA